MKFYCEFPGTKTEPWDGPRKGKCQHLGFRTCVLHKQPVKENNKGWRQPCEACSTPYYQKDCDGSV